MPSPSPELTGRARGVAQAARAVRLATVSVLDLARREGFKFPDLLDDTLRSIERSTDRLFLLLDPQRLVAQDIPGRNDPEAGAQASS